MDYIPFFLPFLLLMAPLSLPLPSALHPSFFLSLLLLPHHFTDPPALHSRPLSYLFQSFILVFPVLREYSLLISSEHSHRLLSWCNSVADIPSCTYESQSAPHSNIVYSEILSFKITTRQCITYRKSASWPIMDIKALQNSPHQEEK